MNPANQPWNRLVSVARLAPVDFHGDETAPSGFSTRVVALARTGQSVSTSAMFERLGMRALGCAMAVLLACAVWNVVPTATAASSADGSLDLIDPVGEVMQMVQAS